MSIISLKIPQLGEGLHEALLVEYLRRPGDLVRRDEPLYVMETDKATSEVESPVEGRLVEWLVEPGTVLAIGIEIGRVEVAGSGDSSGAAGPSGPGTSSHAGGPATCGSARHAGSPVSATEDAGRDDDSAGDAEPEPAVLKFPPESSRRSDIRVPGAVSAGRRAGDGVRIPPRTRRHLRRLELDHRIDEIPVASGKMMPADVDRFLALRYDSSQGGRPPEGTTRDTAVGFDEQTLPREQLTLNFRLQRGIQQVVPATAVKEIDWSAMAEARQLAKPLGGPSAFTLFLWCVTRSLARSHKLRSTIVQEGRVLRTYHQVNLGIAVALPDDRLVTAVVAGADRLPPREFWAAVEERVELAHTGRDQADERVTFTVSNVGTFGLDLGVPVVVPPAVATLALGKVEPRPVPAGNGWTFEPRAHLALTFDHRVINGLGASRFLHDLAQEVAAFRYERHAEAA